MKKALSTFGRASFAYPRPLADIRKYTYVHMQIDVNIIKARGVWQQCDLSQITPKRKKDPMPAPSIRSF